MPKRTILYAHEMDIKHRREPMPVGDSDEVEVKDLWTLLLTDQVTGDRIEITFATETRDALTSKMHHGLVPVFGRPGGLPGKPPTSG